MPQAEQINPAILVWARESAGLAVEDAAKQLALGDSKHESSEQKLLDLERGVRLPTRTQLSRIAKTYRRPLLARGDQVSTSRYIEEVANTGS
jgi:hypothetical protein